MDFPSRELSILIERQKAFKRLLVTSANFARTAIGVWLRRWAVFRNWGLCRRLDPMWNALSFPQCFATAGGPSSAGYNCLFITDHKETGRYDGGLGRTCGVGRGLGVTLDIGVGVGVGVGVGPNC